MKSEYFIVSLDFDGVMAQGLNVKRKYAKKWFGVDLSLEQTKEEGFNALMKSLGISKDYRSLMDPINENHIMEYEIPSGCLDALIRLGRDNFRFVVITSRNEHDYPYAVHFLKQNFGDVIRYVHNTRNHPKDFFVRRLKPRIHIDDDVSKLVALHELPLELFYYRQPENSHQKPIGRMMEITDWQIFEDQCRFHKSLDSAICWKLDIANTYSNIREIFGLKKQMNDEQKICLLRHYHTANS